MGKNSQRRRAASQPRRDGPPGPRDTDGRAGGPPRDRAHQQRLVDDRLEEVVRRVVADGWTPVDLHEVLHRRKLPTDVAGHVLDVVATLTDEVAGPLVHPRWRAQLEQLGARTVQRPRTAGWARRSGRGWPEAEKEADRAMFVLRRLPRLALVVPAPGSHGAAEPSTGHVDEKVLRRIRALLGKAESTPFAAEAEALSAKAQELMTRYSVDSALADSALADGGVPRGAVPAARRIWLDAPYVSPKSMLVSAVARANHCRSVYTGGLGFVTLVGHPGDLDVVELMSTSLLVQATRAMTAAGAQVDRWGDSRTRSFRHSFLVAYAGRIGERLRESADHAAAQAVTEHGGVLVPVLAGRRAAVDDALAEMFPRLDRHQVSVSNPEGYGAGRSAADLAQLGVRAHLGSGPAC